MTRQGNLVNFVRESNAIEGIHRDPLQRELDAHGTLLRLDEIRVEHLETFVGDVAGASLRRLPGMNVIVGPHEPPPGGPKIEAELAELLTTVTAAVSGEESVSPLAVHIEYETLYPFTDGNGRSGRVLWAWQVAEEGRDPFALPFLQRWYYDSLEALR